MIVGPTNAGRIRFLVNQLSGLFKGGFDYILLLCLTLIHNRAYEGFAGAENGFLIRVPDKTRPMIDIR